jgi:hypothetical protein
MPDSHRSVHWLTRRGVLGASAAVGVVAVSGPAALAATAGEGRPERRDGAAAGAGAERSGREPAEGTADQGSSAHGTGSGQELWGTSSSGEGTGVRGNGRLGVLGEGTHTGVAGDGFIGVTGTTSGIHDGQAGVGVWAQADTPAGVALRADGPAEFSGVTTFARSGVVTVPAGSASATKTEVSLSPGSVILATMQTRADNVYVHAVETDPAAGSFTIFLTAAAAADVRIGWFAIG